ncbi:hypothetical protein OIU84_028762 [Salix udensis]|uniref:Uncharacterized protein n=1 Tax=Salix udensis TaxID=889485 RepID=A0AAD6KFL3_9ROSI|nr:hypothetical protein OIU84_028762 [Salix udensis]
MKERQRWQPEEDAILRAYVKQHGPKEWNLISQRVEAAGKTLNRDPKSCLERWKNYLKPGIKKGCLTPDEQALVVSLQAREKQSKSKSLLQHHRSTQYSDQHHQREGTIPVTGDKASSQGKYDHILETFAEKYVQPKILNQFQSFPCSLSTMMPPMPEP